MPWDKDSDATRHTKKATTSKAKKQWRHVANSMLDRGKSEGAAVRAANGVIKKRGKRGRMRGRS